MNGDFRIGVMQLTMEPVSHLIETAKLMDHYGFDSLWLAEAYPWWRGHGVEVRSATAVSPVLVRETQKLSIGWGIVSSYSRHPLTIAMDARVTQECAGPGRFLLGIGASKILMNEIGQEDDNRTRPRTNVIESLEIVRETLSGRSVNYNGREWSAKSPPLHENAVAPDWPVPIYIGGGGPRMMEAAGQYADGLITPSLTTPAYYDYALTHMAIGADRVDRDVSDLDLGATLIASIGRDPVSGRAGARELLGRYLVNKVRNIRGASDALLSAAGLTKQELMPIVEAIETQGPSAMNTMVTDNILDKTKVIAGTPQECIALIEEHRKAGCKHITLELWGDNRSDQIKMFGEEVLPYFRD